MAIKLSDHFTYRKLLKSALLPILMMVCISTYSTIDGLFISNFVGDMAFAGLNIIFPATMIIAAVGFMFGAGGAALVSKKLGEGNREEANRAFSGIVFFVMILGVIISIVCFALMEKIAVLFGATPEILPYALTYGRIYMLGEVAFMTQVMFHTFCAVAEKSWLGFLLSVVSGVINIALDALFILVFKWGLAGAAVASVTGQVVGSAIAIIYFSRKNSSLLKLTKPTFKPSILLKTMTNGSSEFLSNIASAVVGIAFNLQLIKYAGESGVVAYGVIMNLGFLFNAIFIGYTIATAPIIGYNFGAKNNDEIKNVLIKSVVINLLIGLTMFVMSIGLSIPVAKLFVGYNDELVSLTISAMEIYAFSFIIFGFNIFVSSFFTALNNGLISAISSTSRTLVFETVCVMLLPLLIGVKGIWCSILIAEGLSLLLNVILLLTHKKKYKY